MDGLGWIGPGTEAHLLQDNSLSEAVPGVGDSRTTAVGLWEPRVSACVQQARVKGGLIPSCSSHLHIQCRSMQSSPELWPEATKTPISELHR